MLYFFIPVYVVAAPKADMVRIKLLVLLKRAIW
jgi:hypothetical protein